MLFRSNGIEVVSRGEARRVHREGQRRAGGDRASGRGQGEPLARVDERCCVVHWLCRRGDDEDRFDLLGGSHRAIEAHQIRAAVSGGGAKLVQDTSLDASTVPVLERISSRIVSVPELGMTTELKVKFVPLSPIAPAVAGVLAAST